MLRRALAALVAGAVALVAAPAPAGADNPQVIGSGSTWSAVAIQQWRADVANRLGLRIEYSATGSTLGRYQYIQKVVDFGVSEIPFIQPDDDAAAGNGNHLSDRPFNYLPIVAGGTSLMYNLRDAAGNKVTDLRLSADTVAKIFSGQIRDWSDPQITADHGSPLPAHYIQPIVRADGSGTTAQFDAYLSHAAAGSWCEFKRTYQNQPCDAYVQFFTPIDNYELAKSGSDGVANAVNEEPAGIGRITYVERAYALQRKRPVVSLKNASGSYTQPTAANVAVALSKATLNPDRTQVLTGVYDNTDPAAYPMSSYSYMIVPTSTAAPMTAAKGTTMARFVYYFVCEGQQKADVLGYSPLPPNLVRTAVEAASQIPGAPPPPTLDAKGCPNPTITGKAGPSAPSTGGGTSAGAGRSSTGAATGGSRASGAATAGQAPGVVSGAAVPGAGSGRVPGAAGGTIGGSAGVPLSADLGSLATGGLPPSAAEAALAETNGDPTQLAAVVRGAGVGATPGAASALGLLLVAAVATVPIRRGVRRGRA